MFEPEKWYPPFLEHALAATTRLPKLHGRAFDIRIGAVDATIAAFGLQKLAAPLALVKPLAGLSWHRLKLAVPTITCGQAKPIAERHLAAVEAKLCEITRLKAALSELIGQCSSETAECPILRGLLDE